MYSESIDACERRAAMVGVYLEPNIVDGRCNAWLNVESLNVALLEVIGNLRYEV